MCKIRLFIALSTYLVMLSCGITGCVRNNENFVITEKQTSITESYGVEDSAFEDVEEYIDYENYLKKIWVVEDWNGGAYEYPSFFISDIQNSEMKGRYSTNSVAKPDFYFYSHDPSKYLGQLSGSLKDVIAYLKFSDAVGNMGNIVLSFKEDDKIEANIEYTEKGDNYKDIELDGDFFFVPYNLETIQNFKKIEEHSFPVEFDSWGNIRFVTGEIDTGDKIHPVSYLTNEHDDILYDFDAPFKTGTRISDAKIMDVNNDGLKDVIIITKFIQDDEIEPIEWAFMQKEDGTFYSSLLNEE